MEAGRLKEFLENESKRLKSEGRRIPHYVKQFFLHIDPPVKLSPDEIYIQLTAFTEPRINQKIRIRACQYMLKYIPSRNLNTSGSFREINYLINVYKKQKNRTELLNLKSYIEEYPLLEELYREKINYAIIRI